MSKEAVAGQLKTLRETGGYFIASDFGLIEIYGSDAQRFLQAQTTNDVSLLAQESSQMTCLLDRKAHIRAYFELFRRHNSYRIIARKVQIPTILEHFDEYRFNEQVEILDLSHTGQFVAIEGPHTFSAVLSMMQEQPHPDILEHSLGDMRLKKPKGVSAHAFKTSLSGERGVFLFLAKNEFESAYQSVADACRKAGMVELSEEAVEVARIERGYPKFDIDYSIENFLPETGLDETAVSYTKGCFLGQEVLARVRAQGAPTRGLMGLTFEPGIDAAFSLGEAVVVDGNQVAWLKSNCYSPTLDRVIALAYVKRDYRSPGVKLDCVIAGAPYTVRVTTLPFVEPESAEARAKRLFDRALTLYASESEASDSSPSVMLLKECLQLKPDFEDAYEALGVILSKCGKLDEAIELMLHLAELNQDSVMAHTNLSVFYVEKGMIEKAEEEKAISMSIRMKLAAREAQASMKDKEEQEQRRQEARTRKEMFEQVLAIDSEDLLANYGLGNCHVDLDEFEQAIPFLRKAIELKPSYTVAYLALARALEELHRTDESISMYKEGIAVAAKRGDMTPLKEMQQRLAKLESREKPQSHQSPVS